MAAIKHLSVILVAVWINACGEFDRDNPMDPVVIDGVDLRQSLVGTWSRDDAE